MKPFLYDHLFDISTNIEGKIKYINKEKILILDGFFKNFLELQNMVFSCPPGNWKYKEGTKNYVDYYDCRLSFLPHQNLMLHVSNNIIKEQYGKDTKLQDVVEANWFKQIKDKRNDYAWPHQDSITDSKYTCLIYMNSESLGGTAFFEQIQNDSNTEELDYWGSNPTSWKMIDYVEMQPNRMVVFPAKMFHAAYHPKNGFFNNPRINIVYWMEE